MGGRGETSDQKIRATQDQLRLARITQDVSSVDDDRANVQKLIKKVNFSLKASCLFFANRHSQQKFVEGILWFNFRI